MDELVYTALTVFLVVIVYGVIIYYIYSNFTNLSMLITYSLILLIAYYWHQIAAVF